MATQLNNEVSVSSKKSGTVDPNINLSSMGDSREGTTTFIDDANKIINNQEQVYHLPDGFLKTIYSGVIDQSLKDFLAKPIVLTTNEFKTTDTFSTFFNNFLQPYGVLTSSQGALWLDKLKGFYGIRMTMKFTMVVNADPFQQGRYIMAWVPLAGAKYDGIKTPLSYAQNLCTLVQRTTVPHVEIDLNNDTTAELVVPFVSVKNFYNLQEVFSLTHLTDLGVLSLYPYEPLVSPAGSTTATYTVYCSLHDVELYGAASPQSGLGDLGELGNRLNNANSYLKNSKILSKTTGALGQISKYSADLASLMGNTFVSAPLYSVSWIMNAASDLAKSHGYSKPNQGDGTVKVQLITNPNHSTQDGDSDARSLGMSSSLGVASMPGLAATKYDEMSYVSMATRFAWFKTETLSTATVVGNFSSTNISYYYGLSAGGNDHLQPLSLLSLMHDTARGGIKIRVKFVKTKFHSGRLSFAFFPVSNGINLTGDANYVNRWIVDIRTQSEITMTLPYISDAQWHSTGDPFGILKVDVVSALVAPANVSSSIKLLYEVAACEDIEFAMPGPLNQSMIIAAPESGLYSDPVLKEENLGVSSINADPLISTATSVGEKIVSARAYLRRFFPFRATQGSVAGVNKFNKNFNSIITDVMPVMPTSTSDTFPSDPIAILTRCFAISRGGYRYRFITGSGNTTPTTVSLTVNYPASDATVYAESVTSLNGIYTGYSRAYQQTTNNSSITVEVPQYNTYFGRATADIWTTGFATSKYLVNKRTPSTIVHAIPSSTVLPANTDGYENTNVFRALADDGDLMCFVSVPPIRDVTSLRIGSWRGNLF